MLIHELTPAECADVLKKVELGRLGCARYDQPYVVPIHFSFDAKRDCVYAFSMVGQKIRWMRDNPKVCLEVEDIADKTHWVSVLITGRYEEIDQSPEGAEVRKRAEHLFEQRQDWWLPGAGRVPSQEHPQVVLYRIQIDRMSGRRAARPRE
jgi:nitroimidazol reductase NimA-like FMN-containing flavoprotein (pyridoxamine 5'-phosphate oxidase superfamily)